MTNTPYPNHNTAPKAFDPEREAELMRIPDLDRALRDVLIAIPDNLLPPTPEPQPQPAESYSYQQPDKSPDKTLLDYEGDQLHYIEGISLGEESTQGLVGQEPTIVTEASQDPDLIAARAKAQQVYLNANDFDLAA